MEENKNPNPPGTESGAAETKASKGLQTKHIVLILGVLVIIAAAAVAAYVLTRPQTLPMAETGGAPVMNEDNMEQIMAEVGEKVAKGMFHTYMNTTWRFPDGKSASSNAVMGNAAENNYAFWFDVTLKDSGDEVYASSLLPVGTQLKEIILSKDLDKGEYAAVVRIHMIDENNEPVEGNTGFNITLVIQN
jgi:hypothetical protein